MKFQKGLITFVDPEYEPTGDESGFGGYAFVGGISYELAQVVDLPLGISLSYRFQRLSLGDFAEDVQQMGLGAFHRVSAFFDRF